MEKGQILEFTIEDMSNEGSGIGRAAGEGTDGSGIVVFVNGAVVGDRVRARLVKVKKNYAIAALEEILEESEYRQEDTCPYMENCGGCSFGNLEYGTQLAVKENQVRSKLERLAGIDFEDSVYNEITGMSPADNADSGCFAYRNKAVMPISTGGLMTKKGGVQEPVHEPRIGFYQAKSHDVTDCEDCRLQAETAMAAARATRSYMEEDHICSYDKRWDKGLMKSMTVKTAFGTGEVMVIYDINGKGIPNASKLIEYLDDAVYEAGGNLESVVIRNDKKTETLAGKPTITDIVEIDGREYSFEISANSFYQVNHVQMQRLYSLVREYCTRAIGEAAGSSNAGGGKPVILDLYCGIGTIGLCLADMAEHVHGIEIVKDAVTDANRNATINGIVNATYTCGKAEQLIPEWFGTAGGPCTHADIAVLDPPRSGCRPELLDTIAEADIPAVIYVSCDPGTLSRDLKLLHEKGYRLVEATPVDMFPHTSHVETCCLLRRGNLV